MQDYALIFLNSSIAADRPEAFLSLMLLGLARLLPIIAMSPFFGARVLPTSVKVTFGLSLFVIFLPTLLTKTETPLYFNMTLIFLMLKEAFVGFSIGFIMSTPFTIVQNAGIIIDHQRGGASLMVNDPTVQNQSSPLGTLFNMVLIYLFYLIDGPFYFMNAIITSYEVLPPDKVLSPLFFSADSPFWKVQFDLFGKVMNITAQLAAPALIAILMTDVFLGIANRLAPQVQITFLGMPLKSLLALLVVCMGWKLFNQQVIVVVFQWFEILKTSISAFSL